MAWLLHLALFSNIGIILARWLPRSTLQPVLQILAKQSYKQYSHHKCQQPRNTCSWEKIKWKCMLHKLANQTSLACFLYRELRQDNVKRIMIMPQLMYTKSPQSSWYHQLPDKGLMNNTWIRSQPECCRNRSSARTPWNGAWLSNLPNQPYFINHNFCSRKNAVGQEEKSSRKMTNQ